jgi:hypothetical protein
MTTALARGAPARKTKLQVFYGSPICKLPCPEVGLNAQLICQST